MMVIKHSKTLMIRTVTDVAPSEPGMWGAFSAKKMITPRTPTVLPLPKTADSIMPIRGFWNTFIELSNANIAPDNASKNPTSAMSPPNKTFPSQWWIITPFEYDPSHGRQVKTNPVMANARFVVAVNI
ncbi:MAG: hypothetical protein JW839_13525 [Candidatus Lokiarchaeota archaeon]|nr:hypothetical protein [Candidatus Lokiarchaeota archaeon]